MTRTPLPLFRETLQTPIGEAVILTDAQGRLRALDFADFLPRMHRLLVRHYGPGGYAISDAPAPSAALRALAAYFDGDLAAIDVLETATGGTPFQREVWAALRAIPVARTKSYGALAAHLGRAGSSRAVGLANGSNPVAIVAPCHRVVGADGSLTGYAGGLERKRWLLEHERRHERGAAPGQAAGSNPQ